MDKQSDLAEAACLLSQAASSLINQSSQPSSHGHKQQDGEGEGLISAAFCTVCSRKCVHLSFRFIEYAPTKRRYKSCKGPEKRK